MERAGGPESDRLLHLTAGYLIEHGVGELTLRRLGQAIGTNNRMLLYYFGSKEELIGRALLAASLRFPRLTGALAILDERHRPLVDRLDDCWAAIADRENMPFLRLFFEVFGQAASHPARFDRFRAGVGHDWTARVAAALRAEGVPDAAAAGLARELVALWRGLQFDLLSTGEADAVTAAHATAAVAFAQRCADAAAGGGPVSRRVQQVPAG